MKLPDPTKPTEAARPMPGRTARPENWKEFTGMNIEGISYCIELRLPDRTKRGYFKHVDKDFAIEIFDALVECGEHPGDRLVLLGPDHNGGPL